MKRSIKPQKKVKYLTNEWMTYSPFRLDTKLFEALLSVKVAALVKGHMESSDIFLKQNKGKGPPGGRLNPERVNNLSPDNKTAARKGIKINQQKIYQINQYQLSNFYHKQIFIHN